MPSRREEQAALGKELETTKAELLDLQLKRDKISWCSTDITESKMRLQELADCLRAALQEEVGPLPWGRGQEGGRGGFQTPVALHGVASRPPLARRGSRKLSQAALWHRVLSPL